VEVRGGVCLAGKTLAGSVLTMDKAVENLRAFTGSSLAVAVRLASRNPAAMLNLPHLAAVEPGQPANFNIFDETGTRTGSYFRGNLLT
jgi:N-acetylglucosamine-6-phosphate deacetylase